MVGSSGINGVRAYSINSCKEFTRTQGLSTNISGRLAHYEFVSRPRILGTFSTEDRAVHLEPSIIQIGIQRNNYLRGYAYAFIELFAPRFDRAAVRRAVQRQD